MKKYTNDILSLPLQFRKDWARKLRSGEIKQTRTALFDGDDGYCCLGVAGLVKGLNPEDMFGEEQLPYARYGLKGDVDFDPILIDSENIEYAKTVAAVKDSFFGMSASECNDILRLPFSQIADLIYQEK